MTVLIIADDAAFARDLVGRWQAERNVPAFAVVSSAVWQGADGGFDLAIVGPMEQSQLAAVLRMLQASSRAPVFLVGDAAVAQLAREEFPRVLVLRRYQGWLDAAVLIANEALRRVEASARAQAAEQALTAEQRCATLGRFMLEMRHNLNNALTSVLGNAELLLLEPAALSHEVRDQVKTIHCMAMRIHEVWQRFSSLEVEMHFAGLESQTETETQAHDFGEAT
jgi:signal transduction histidine kinase